MPVLLGMTCADVWKRGSSIPLYTYIYNLFIKHYPFPPLQGWCTSCLEMSYSKRETKLKERKKKIFPLIPFKLQFKLGYRCTFTLHSLHIAVATYNYGILSRSRVHPTGYTPYIPPYKSSPFTPILHHSPCLLDIQTFFHKQSFMVSIHLFCGLPTQ